MKKITSTKSAHHLQLFEKNYNHKIKCKLSNSWTKWTGLLPFGLFWSILSFNNWILRKCMFFLSVSLFKGKHEGMRENFEKQTYSEPLKTKMPHNFGQYFAIPATVYNILVLWRLETKSALLQGQPRSAVLMHSGTRSSKMDQY